jgi:predicted CXXCH cytochrome family protein
VAREDYDRHVTRWNDNCVFCHNVHPNPGLDAEHGRFSTQVAELGVACEACHGPGGEHVARNSDPWRRYTLHLTHRPDPTIRNPARMTPERSAEVCGRCHGQRIAPDIARVQAHGDPFIPGEALGHYSRPLARDTTQNGATGVFAPRFWQDGTARLTAYEYQGYLQSPCVRGGRLTCESCHSMHDAEPSGQLRHDRSADAVCTHCHSAFATPSAQAAHTHHRAAGAGARCLSCHMPSIVYGLVDVHLSHRIETPEPGQQALAQRPDACTLCHIDRSRSWAIDAATTTQRRGGARPSAASSDLPAMTEALLGGDPIERAVAAHALGQPQAHFASSYLPQLIGLLLEALSSDSYPAVRAIAARSLRSLLQRTQPGAVPLLAAYTATDDSDARNACLQRVRARLGADAVASPKPAVVTQLRARTAATAIEIGE